MASSLASKRNEKQIQHTFIICAINPKIGTFSPPHPHHITYHTSNIMALQTRTMLTPPSSPSSPKSVLIPVRLEDLSPMNFKTPVSTNSEKRRKRHDSSHQCGGPAKRTRRSKQSSSTPSRMLATPCRRILFFDDETD